MTFKRADSTSIAGTSKKGEFMIDYDQLQNKFGDPETGVDPHTNAEWWLKFSDGTVATIYDWGPEGDYKKNQQWTVGGSSKKAFYYVMAILTVNRKAFFREMWKDIHGNI